VFTDEISYTGETFIDSLFTAVSALCVTGLTSTDFANYSFMGQVIVLILIQMGGLGIIVFTSIFAFLITRGISERAIMHSLLAGILDTDRAAVGRMLYHVILYTLLFEGIGTLLLTSRASGMSSDIGNMNPFWWGLFHSVSAFNNAGFGLMQNNLMNYVEDPIVNLTIATLVIAGGLGYPVLIAAHAALRRLFVKRFDNEQSALDKEVQSVVASPMQTKIAVHGTILLLAIGTLIPLFIEWNSAAFNGLSIWGKFIASFFQSVSTRTAGFNTVDIGAMTAATLFLYIALMFIGANPAGTAGGIKIPTVAVLYAYMKDWFQKPGEPLLLHKQVVSKFALSHAVRLYFFSTIFIAAVTMTICIIESPYLITPDPTFNFLKIFFEIVSAFGTVGLSMGFPGSVTSFSAILSPASKLLIILTMIFGRLGPLTVLAALPWKRTFANHPLTPDYENAQKLQIG
jgi:trk system potassium uptake protein TrkH